MRIIHCQIPDLEIQEVFYNTLGRLAMYPTDEIVFVKDLYPKFYVNDTYSDERKILLLSDILPVPRNGHHPPLYVITRYSEESLEAFLEEMMLEYNQLNFISDFGD